MTAGRSLLALLGLGLVIAGIAVAWSVDRLIGMGLVIAGAMVLVLPFATSYEGE